MGGKTKQTQRTKNNAKPSNSSRSAELLGTAIPSFVGFSAHSDLGLVPFVPGFGTSDQMPDAFDASVSPEFQLVLRKMSKKDPLTKKKALQEFIELVNASDMETIKSILPLWPKFYHNLASDPEHNVRELAQTVLQLLVSKGKRAVAPYLKQLVPVWLASHYDNYAPAASIASASFRETFAGNANRTQEVCLHCQTEIIEYATRNLTFHTPATLSSGKNLTPEESEQKFQRVVTGSLKALCFFVEHTTGASDRSQIHSSLQSMLAHQKFWSFSKHKTSAVKAAWFEFIYQVLQSPDLVEVTAQTKSQLFTVCFQNIDESDPLVAPHVWGCILLLQAHYDDWHTTVNFKKAVLPKFSSLLRNGCNRNAQAICPNLLPFFSNLLQKSLQDVDHNEFCKQFFDDLKNSISTQNNNISKADYSTIIRAYFECLRFLLHKICNKSDRTPEKETLAMRLLHENIIEPIGWFLSSESASIKSFFLQTSALVAFWSDRQATATGSSSGLYSQLLGVFWTQVVRLITEGIENKEVGEHFTEHVIQLVHDLHLANPSLEDQRVKFAIETESGESRKQTTHSGGGKETQATSAAFIQNELKQLVVQLVRLCIDNISKQNSSKYISHVRRMTKMFSDVDFYTHLTAKRNLHATLDLFVGLIDALDEEACEVVMDVVFEILQKLDKPEQFAYINTNLLKIPHIQTQPLVLQRLLSYPLCIEPEVRTMLSQPEASGIIENMAREVVYSNSKEKLNLLHKCFFQTDTGEILISSSTVDAILSILSEPLDAVELNDMADACCSFIAQIMPVVCSNNNSSKSVQHAVFLKLFKFTMERTVNDFISEDTLWEITTCWQDALSSEDIVIDVTLLQSCADVVEQRVQAESVTPAAIDTMSEAMAKFITCSTENIQAEKERFEKIDASLAALFRLGAKSLDDIQHLSEFCIFMESLKGLVSPSVELSGNSTKSIDMKSIFRRTLLNFGTIIKLVCRANHTPNNAITEATDDEITDDYCDPDENLLKHWSDLLFEEILKCINIASVGDSLLNVMPELDPDVEILTLELSEKVKMLLRNGSDIVDKIKERMLLVAAKETDVTPCRSLGYLVHCEQYAQFEENATILLMEDLSEYFVTKMALKAYVNSLQFLMPNLEAKAITVQSAIMRTEPSDLWIKAAVFRCLVCNNFNVTLNEKSDKNIIVLTLQFITEVAEKQHAQKDLLLYNVEIHKQPFANVVNSVEYINLLTEVISRFPYELNIKNWDAIRIGLSSWVLSISKSIDDYTNPKSSIFIVAVFKLFAALTNFVISEKQKSSTELLKNVVDEWESLFAREVNLVLFKSFYSLCSLQETPRDNLECYISVLDEISPALTLIDYSFVHSFCKSSTKITLDNVFNFLLKNLSNSIHSVRTTSMHIVRQLTQFFIAEDIATFEKNSETLEGQGQLAKWHYLNRFEDYIARYDFPIRKYLNEFSFKLTEIVNLEPVDRNEAFSYLMLWDCIIYACAHSPVSLRSVYTNWLNENKYEENLLHFLFRGMPVEILKNHDSKLMNSDIFKGLSWSQITERNLSLEKYVCHMYTEMLRKLPAVVRKWWNTCPSRQKTFVDKLTTNFISALICSEELKAIGNKKEKHENMQVTVHTSTREVLAVYSIDEARMELVITLAQNYPLGAVKVECGKQIGGRSSSRNVGMQLTIFLTHQNGTIFDGLTLWKNNLDKKFEGVEECYVCYTVIHQDTCQLPKLSCRTCKKKFHGPCLYKWFTTSSKSTCPICRNVF